MHQLDIKQNLSKIALLISVLSATFCMNAAHALSSDTTTQISLTAFDTDNAREFHLTLQPNLLNSTAASIASSNNIQLFRGQIENDNESWVRLTKSNEHFSGMLYSNGEWFDINNSELPLKLINVTQHYQSLVRNKFEHRSIDKLLIAPALKLNNSAHRNDTRMDDDGLPKGVKIGVVVDSLFNEYFGGNGLERALTIINNVDGIYQSQFGINIIVDAVRLYDDPDTDPLREVPDNLETLINRYRDVRLSDSTLRRDLALVHVFSGHARGSQQAVGVGWIDTLCREDGFNMSLSTPFELDTLLAAHEMGHNFGALHDSDINCSGLVNEGINHIMSDRLSAASQDVFSQCSVVYISPARTASCQFENIDLSLGLSALPTDSTVERIISVQIQNTDVSRDATDVFSRTVFPPNTLLTDQSAGCTTEFSTMICNHGRIGAGLLDVVSVKATVSSVSNIDVSSTLELSTIVDTEISNNSDSLNVPLSDAPGNQNGGSGDVNVGGNAGYTGLYEALILLLVALRRRRLHLS